MAIDLKKEDYFFDGENYIPRFRETYIVPEKRETVSRSTEDVLAILDTRVNEAACLVKADIKAADTSEISQQSVTFDETADETISELIGSLIATVFDALGYIALSIILMYYLLALLG